MSERLSDLPRWAELESAWRSRISECVTRECVDAWRPGLRAIVLTGSLARGEATFVQENDRCTALGDAEFVLVFVSRASIPAAAAVKRVRDRIAKALSRNGIACPVGLSVVDPSFLTRSRPHVFAVELRNCGQVVWGERRILDLMPSFGAADIPLEDAWRLLQNRLIEMLEAPASAEPGVGNVPAEMQYRSIKLYLDSATSLLVFARRFEAGYQARSRQLSTLAADPKSRAESWPLDLAEFSRTVELCTRAKLTGEASIVPADWDFWFGAVSAARQIWRWELCQLTDLERDASDSELFSRWASMQPLKDRIRGWLYALRCEGWLRSRIHWSRWINMAPRWSPRYYIYHAASALLFSPYPAIPTGILNGLPLCSGDRSNTGRWSRVANEIWMNYKQLLSETRA